MSEEDDYSLEFTERNYFEKGPLKGGVDNTLLGKKNLNGPAAAIAKKAPGAASGPQDVNALVMRSLQKLLNGQNLGAINQRPRLAANGNVVRRVNNAGGPVAVRRQPTANNVIQKRRFNPNANFNGNVNGNIRNNRRFI